MQKTKQKTLVFAEGIDDLQVPKTYDKPLNCVIFLEVYFDD